MTSEIMTVMIDERRQLDSLNDVTMVRRNGEKAAAYTTRPCVFKDYLLSSEVFYVDYSMN